jgi:hypothetical protein
MTSAEGKDPVMTSETSAGRALDELNKHFETVRLEMHARDVDIAKRNTELFKLMLAGQAVGSTVDERSRQLAEIRNSLQSDTRDAPFDQGWTTDPNATSANQATGDYQMSCVSIDGAAEMTVSAGIGAWFTSGFTQAPPAGLIGNNLLEVDLRWALSWQSANGAHNYLRTILWVWGQTEQAWVAQDYSNGPQLDDSTVITGHSHGGNVGDTRTIKTLFNSVAGGTYECFAWNTCSVGSGSLGEAKMSLTATVLEMRVFHLA